MIKAQALNKIIASKDIESLLRANIDSSYFSDYKDEFDFILSHYKKYGNVPDAETFGRRFDDFEFMDVEEGYPYIIDALREEKEFSTLVPLLQEVATVAETDARAANELLQRKLKDLPRIQREIGVDIIERAHERYDEYKAKQADPDGWFFSTGLDALDVATGGIQRTEELILLFARTNQGKSWIAEKMAVSVWESGYNIGFFSPEMTANSVGYRFDALYKHFSNKLLTKGLVNESHENEYTTYINELPNGNHSKFIVATPSDFDRKPTVSRFRNWVKDMNLHMLVVDGISYMHDERYRRGDNTTTSLTNIAEDLMNLSIELTIPIIIVAQANREAAGEDKTAAPTLETVRNSDGLAHNASKVFSIRKKHNDLEISIEKQRTGPVGGKLLYNWEVDTGHFTYMPSKKSGLPEEYEKKYMKSISSELDNDMPAEF